MSSLQDILAEITKNLPTNSVGYITAKILRRVLTDIVNILPSFIVDGFNTQLSTQNLTIFDDTNTGTPNIILYNGYTQPIGSFVGSGLIFNCNNSNGIEHTSSYVNGGYVDNTAGHEKGLIDFEVYQGFTSTNRIVSLACNDTASWFAPSSDNYYTLGISGFKWANLYATSITVGSSGGLTVDASGNLVSSGGFASFGGSVIAQNALAIPSGGNADAGFRFSSTDGFGVFFGSGAPSLSAAQGSLYLRSDGTQNNRLYINTNGSTGWTAFNTTS